MKTTIKKMLTIMLAAFMVLSLAACGTKTSDNGSGDPQNMDEAVEMYKKLMDQENEILSQNKELWEKVFMAANKRDMTLQEDGKNYGDFLLDTIEFAKDDFTDKEYKILKEGAEKIKELEDQLAALEEKFPGVGEKANGNTGGTQSVPADSVNSQKFPAFDGKTLDGKKVDGEKLFSGNKVTVVNFWFTTCKPCVGELGYLEELNSKLAKQGGEVIGINSYTLDGDKTTIKDAKELLTKKGVTYKNVWFKSDSEAGKFTEGIYSFPTTYVVDQNGNIVGDPIVGGITSAEQKEALNKLIDKAMENSK